MRGLKHADKPLSNLNMFSGGYNYTVGTKHGFFRPDLLWPIAMGGMYLFSLLILLYVIQQRLQVSPFVLHNTSMPCPHLVFQVLTQWWSVWGH